MRTLRQPHMDWLSLLDISGPFLSPPVIDRVFPQGLDVIDSEVAATLRLFREEWAEDQQGLRPNPTLHDQWIRLVLMDGLSFTPQVLLVGDSIPSDLVLYVPEHRTAIRPDFVVVPPKERHNGGHPRLLISVYPPGQHLDGMIDGSPWAASPSLRMTQLCRSAGVRLGLLTNGEQWMLVDAAPGQTSAYISWFASFWSQEPDTLRAFRSLLDSRRFFGVEEANTLEAMLTESASYQAEVTEQLGSQVRRAVEVLIQALDRADADTGRKLLHDVPETELYEAAITVMMRLVFLFFAEENGLLLLGDELYDLYYAASVLRGQLREEADRVGVEVLERRQDAWSRLLATFRGIFGGVEHESLHLLPYGGSLFDPDRFPFLEGRGRGTTWRETEAMPLPLDNRTVLHLLDALQLLNFGGRGRPDGARRLSFRALDIEQIGHVYESLLDHTAMRATSPHVGLIGPRGAEPEVSLDDLDAHRERGEETFLAFLEDRTRRSKAALRTALNRTPAAEVAERIRVTCKDDDKLFERALPYHALLRTDAWGEPSIFGVGSLFVTIGTSRRSTGTYYTPRALTEEIVSHALEPLVYEGPIQGKPRGEWELETPQKLLDLKICDPAMGSGAFLVQACRWLGERLLEAWKRAGADRELITPEGARSTGRPSEIVVPQDDAERRALARRLVADRCLYGVDVNPLATEMAKLSLWLITSAKGRPFSFLDHALRCGDSLLGVHQLDQIRSLHPAAQPERDHNPTLWNPSVQLDSAIQRAFELRERLEAFPVSNVKDAEFKARLNHEANNALEPLRAIADLIIGAAMETSGGGHGQLDGRLLSLAEKLLSTFESQQGGPPSETRQPLGFGEATYVRKTFHWPLEFPEVFTANRGGFDLMLGNPPFLGGVRISEVLGDDYNAYLARLFPPFSRRVDLCAFFLRRDAALLRPGGVIASLATNTISQGQTRRGGLDVLVASGHSIYRAKKSFPWPGDASVVAAAVWLYGGQWPGERTCDSLQCEYIGPLLEAQTKAGGLPFELRVNTARCFQGPTIWGEGFYLSDEEAQSLLSEDPRNAEVVRPFMGGKELNTTADLQPSRWVIAMGERNEASAASYVGPFQVLEKRVKVWRQSLDRRKYSRVVDGWWKYFHARSKLFGGIRSFRLSRVLARSRVSDHHMIAFLSADIMFSDALVVFLFDGWDDFAVIQSSIHDLWSRRFSSTMKSDVRYIPPDCFYTFPLPHVTVGRDLKEAGERYYLLRSEVMETEGLGMTKLYNRFHAPDDKSSAIIALRKAHERLDAAVLDAYGWKDVPMKWGFQETPLGIRYGPAASVWTDVSNRLVQLNHERYRNEVRGRSIT